MISVETPFFMLLLVIYVSGAISDNPYQVSIQMSSGFHICSGAIITARHILTSAHCIADNKRMIRSEVHHVVTGNIDSTEINANNIFEIVQIKIHDGNSSSDVYENDIAILKVHGDMTLEGRGMVISLPSNDTIELRVGMASGWEVNKSNQLLGNTETFSFYLRKTHETILDGIECILRMLPAQIQPEHVCAQSKEKLELCHSDGGALLVHNHHLIGIMSYNHLCDRSYIGVYTRVYRFVPWIEKVIKTL